MFCLFINFNVSCGCVALFPEPLECWKVQLRQNIKYVVPVIFCCKFQMTYQLEGAVCMFTNLKCITCGMFYCTFQIHVLFVLVHEKARHIILIISDHHTGSQTSEFRLQSLFRQHWKDFLLDRHKDKHAPLWVVCYSIIHCKTKLSFIQSFILNTQQNVSLIWTVRMMCSSSRNPVVALTCF